MKYVVLVNGTTHDIFHYEGEDQEIAKSLAFNSLKNLVNIFRELGESKTISIQHVSSEIVWEERS
jgi:hypothetical protein